MKNTRKKPPYLLITFLLVLAWSVLIEPRWVAVRHFSKSLPLSSKPLGLKLVITSDWRFTKRPLWPVMTVERAKVIVQEINATKPDVVLIFLGGI